MVGFGPFVEKRSRGQLAWIHEDLVGIEPAELWADLQPLAGAKGRGGVGVLAVSGRQLVVRPYRRGGALARVLNDRYLRPERARCELEVLHRLQQAGVPVVRPIAAAARRSGLAWQLRLCTERLPDAMPMPAFLAAAPELRRSVVEAVGRLVQSAFAAGLQHPDLHPDNVLCRPVAGGDGACDHGARDDVSAVLVDLDRARVAPPLPAAARDAMLVRMQRYVVKHRERLAAVPTRSETMRFLRSCGFAGRGERRAAFARLRDQLARELQRRGRSIG